MTRSGRRSAQRREVTFSEASLAALNGMQGGRAGATGKLVQQIVFVQKPEL